MAILWRIIFEMSVLVALLPIAAWSCSPGAGGNEMYVSEIVGWSTAGALALLFVFTFVIFRRNEIRSRVPLVLAALFIVHPLWIYGIRGGDCGYVARYGGLLFFGLGIVLTTYSYWRNRKRQKPL